ncbi:MAG TPA: DUF883 C-terminal domain-containing protein [Thermoanaerobaculia bacterium]|jgi:ElaB/YqjD/DUF883 family membrane-anchored ribosome-binding protein
MDENTNPTGAGDTGSGADAAGGGDASNRFGRAKDYAGEKYRAASGAVRDGYNNVRERVDEVDVGALTDQVRTYVRSHPGKALLISVGVGFVLGMLLRRDEDED